MGIAKNFFMIGVLDYYDFDENKFAENISKILSVNINFNVLNLSENRLLDNYIVARKEFGYKNSLGINIEIDSLDDNPDLYTKRYCIPFEINHYFDPDKVMNLDFSPNALVSGILPDRLFGHWGALIEAFKGDLDYYFNSHKDVLDRMIRERETYREQLLSLGLKKILMFPDAYYKFESNLLDIDSDEKITSMNEIVNLAIKQDNLNIFDYFDTIKQSQIGKFEDIFKNIDALNIIFVDDLTKS